MRLVAYGSSISTDNIRDQSYAGNGVFFCPVCINAIDLAGAAGWP